MWTGSLTRVSDALSKFYHGEEPHLGRRGNSARISDGSPGLAERGLAMTHDEFI
jgi:hypothetical protein